MKSCTSLHFYCPYHRVSSCLAWTIEIPSFGVFHLQVCPWDLEKYLACSKHSIIADWVSESISVHGWVSVRLSRVKRNLLCLNISLPLSPCSASPWPPPHHPGPGVQEMTLGLFPFELETGIIFLTCAAPTAFNTLAYIRYVSWASHCPRRTPSRTSFWQLTLFFADVEKLSNFPRVTKVDRSKGRAQAGESGL